jgi:hypothetical protein
MEADMADDTFRKSDRVEWSSHTGTAVGKIVRRDHR